MSGPAASVGRASGHVWVLHSPAEGDRLQTGEILVASMTSRTGSHHATRGGFGTDGGGMTCHAAIVPANSVCRASSVPAMLRRVLGDGELVTVDGAKVKSTRRRCRRWTASTAPGRWERPPMAPMTGPGVDHHADPVSLPSLRQPSRSPNTPRKSLLWMSMALGSSSGAEFMVVERSARKYTAALQRGEEKAF